MTASTIRVESTPVSTATAALSPAFRFPSLTTTVPKEFVHRAAVAEVMLTDWHRTDDTRFRVTAQWPRGHSFFGPIGGHHDPLLAAETIRQVGSLLAHAEFGVPLGHHFLMWDLSFVTHPDRMRMGSAPASLDLAITCTEIKRRGGDLTGLRYEAVIHRDGHVAATGGASYTCTTPAVYRRLRKGRCTAADVRPLPLTAPASPQSVGRLSPMDVVLSPIGEPCRWQLRVDTSHPVLFDHPVDHVPGMVLVEAARQASAAVLGRTEFLPAGITSEFLRYAELDTPCVIEARRLPPETPGEERVLVTGQQDGTTVFTSTVTARPDLG